MTIISGTLRTQISTEQLLDSLQHTAFNFFWDEANPTTGLIKDRSNANGGGGAPCSIASLGFGLTAMCIGVEHGWVTRTAARDRVLTTLQTLWNAPQGTGSTGYAGHKGFFYHFLDMNTAERTWNSELSTIDSGLLFAGILFVREYFDGTEAEEVQIRALADSIYFRADWEWFRNYNQGLLMGWKPVTQFYGYGEWVGYNEAMIMYILGYGSPTHPLQEGWQGWTSGYSTGSYAGGEPFITFGPLFGHQYSHCWVDFRNIRDAYLSHPSRGWDYFENSRRASLAQQAYAALNPNGWSGYSDSLWGITACDGPTGYSARGAPIGNGVFDDGTIAPTAAVSSIVFAPEIVIPTIHNMWNSYGGQLWAKYGFRDAFNLEQNWWASDVIGIDLGPIIIMIENYRTEMVWDVFMQSPYIQEGLSRIGFMPVTSVEIGKGTPNAITLKQNYPNPFNGQTVIPFELPKESHVNLKIFDLLGREVETLIDEVRQAGAHSTSWQPTDLPSGVYLARLQTEGGRVEMRTMVFLK